MQPTCHSTPSFNRGNANRHSPWQFPITALREIKLLKLLSHKNILKLEDMAVEHPSRSSALPQSAALAMTPAN